MTPSEPVVPTGENEGATPRPRVAGLVCAPAQASCDGTRRATASAPEATSGSNRYSPRCKVDPLATTTARFGQMPKQPVITMRDRRLAWPEPRRLSSDFSARFNLEPPSMRLRHFL